MWGKNCKFNVREDKVLFLKKSRNQSRAIRKKIGVTSIINLADLEEKSPSENSKAM